MIYCCNTVLSKLKQFQISFNVEVFPNKFEIISGLLWPKFFLLKTNYSNNNSLAYLLHLVLSFSLRYGRKKEGIKPVIPRGQPATGGMGGEQYPQGGSTGSVEVQSLTEGGGQNSNGIIKSRSPPLCVPTQGMFILNRE